LKKRTCTLDDAKTSLASVINSSPHTQIIPENHQANSFYIS